MSLDDPEGGRCMESTVWPLLVSVTVYVHEQSKYVPPTGPDTSVQSIQERSDNLRVGMDVWGLLQRQVSPATVKWLTQSKALSSSIDDSPVAQTDGSFLVEVSSGPAIDPNCIKVDLTKPVPPLVHQELKKFFEKTSL